VRLFVLRGSRGTFAFAPDVVFAVLLPLLTTAIVALLCSENRVMAGKRLSRLPVSTER
jgi:hypothetical protein